MGSSDRYTGINVDVVTIFQTTGNQLTKSLTRVEKAGKTTEKRDSFFIKAHDTIDYEILY
mgnify:FL=1